MDIEKRHTCLNCSKKFTAAEARQNQPYRPFCSKRCKMIDLGQWLQEKYVVKGEHTADRPKTESNDDGEHTND